MHLLYVLAAYLAALLLWPVLLLHPKLRGKLRRRLGYYDGDPWPEPPRGYRIWLHGASAGDLLALKPLVAELRNALPDAGIMLSTITNTGRAMAEQRLQEVDAVTVLPFDLPGATRRAVAAIRPDVLVLEYTELWPSLIRSRSSGCSRSP